MNDLELLGTEIDSAAENNNVSGLITLLEKCDSMIESEDTHPRAIALFLRLNRTPNSVIYEISLILEERIS